MGPVHDEEVASIELHSNARIRIAKGESQYNGSYIDIRRMIPDTTGKVEVFTKSGVRLSLDAAKQLRDALIKILK